jgi:hypothetical protein
MKPALLTVVVIKKNRNSPILTQYSNGSDLANCVTHQICGQLKQKKNMRKKLYLRETVDLVRTRELDRRHQSLTTRFGRRDRWRNSSWCHLHSSEAGLQKLGSSFFHADQVLKGSKVTRVFLNLDWRLSWTESGRGPWRSLYIAKRW